MKSIRAILIALSFVAAGAAVAGPLDSGMVGGQLKSNVNVGTVNQTAKSTVGYAANELNVGSVKGGKAIGNVELTVHAKDITQSAKSTVGYANNEANNGSLK